ncbi:MAG TPA: hypothetical protein VGJ36_03525 [Gemmatimonadales bacterium]|jgi:hypothetical protein
MHCDPDAFPGAQPARITLAPVEARGAIVQKVRVDVYEHPALPRLLLGDIVRKPAQPSLVGLVYRQVEIGFLGGLFLENAILVIYIVEIIDGRFAG